MRKGGFPTRIWVDRSGDFFKNATTTSRTFSGISVRVSQMEEAPVIDALTEVVVLRLQKLQTLRLHKYAFLEEKHRQDVVKQLKARWYAREDEGRKAALWMNSRTSDVYTRTIASNFRTWCFQMLGGVNWVHLFVATGEVSDRLITLVNEHTADVIRREARGREPSADLAPGPRRSLRNEALANGIPEDDAPPRRGVQHIETRAKALRATARELKKQLDRQNEQWVRDRCSMTNVEYGRLWHKCQDQHDY